MNPESRCTKRLGNQSPRLPRAVLTPNLHHGRQDLPNREAKASADHPSERRAKYEETRRSRCEETRPVMLITEFKEYLTRQSRKKLQSQGYRKRLIQQFETHPNRDSSMEDLNKIEEFNPFSEGVDHQRG